MRFMDIAGDNVGDKGHKGDNSPVIGTNKQYSVLIAIVLFENAKRAVIGRCDYSHRKHS